MSPQVVAADGYTDHDRDDENRSIHLRKMLTEIMTGKHCLAGTRALTGSAE